MRAHAATTHLNLPQTPAPRLAPPAGCTARCPTRRPLPLAAAPRGFGARPAETAADNPVLPPPPDLGTKGVRSSWNATALAYLGDSVWELYARRHFFYPPSRLTSYYERVTASVRAEAQDNAYELLRAGAYLTDDERDVLRWGRNAKVTVPKRFGSAGPHADKYRAATAVECLVGYLYLTDARRLHALMAYLGLGGEGAGGAGEAGEGGGRGEGGGGEGGAANAGPAGALPA